MHSVVLENAFQTVCLDLSFEKGQNSSKLTKCKAISLAFFLKMDHFGRYFESL